MIRQHFYWPGIRESAQKEVSNFDTYQGKQLSFKTYINLPAKLDEEPTWNKLCVDLIGP